MGNFPVVAAQSAVHYILLGGLIYNNGLYIITTAVQLE